MQTRYRSFRQLMPDERGGGNHGHQDNNHSGVAKRPGVSRQNSVPEGLDLSYSNMLMNQDGSVLTRDHIRELRERQGYCLTCVGEPVKLYEIKKSKLNPLWKGKDAVDVMHESYQGVCLRCNPQMDPHKSSRRRDSLSTAERRMSGSHASAASIRSLSSFSRTPQGSMRNLEPPCSSGSRTSPMRPHTGTELPDTDVPRLSAPRSSASFRNARRLSNDDSLNPADLASAVNNHFGRSQSAGMSDDTGSSYSESDFDESGDGSDPPRANSSVSLSAVLSSNDEEPPDTGDWDNFSTPDFPENSFKTHRKKKRVKSRRSSRSSRTPSSSSTPTSSTPTPAMRQMNGNLSNIAENSQGELRGDESSSQNLQASFANTGTNDPSHVDKADFTFQADFAGTPGLHQAASKSQKPASKDGVAKTGDPKKKKKKSKLVQKVGDGDWPEIPFQSPNGNGSGKGGAARKKDPFAKSGDPFSKMNFFADEQSDGEGQGFLEEKKSKRRPSKGDPADPKVEAVGAKFQELLLKGKSSNPNESEVAARKAKGSSFHDSMNSFTSPDEEEVPRARVTDAFNASFTPSNDGDRTSRSDSHAFSFEDDEEELGYIGENVDDTTISEIRALLQDVAASGNREFMVDLLVNTMRSHRDTTAIQEMCLNDIWELSKFNDSNKEKIMEAGLADDIVAAMKTHWKSTKVQDNACGALWSLSVNQHNRCVLARSGAVECIFRALEEHVKDESFVETAFGAIRTLSPEAEVRTSISQILGAQRACRVMALHRHSTSIQRDGCAFLSNLAVDMDRQEVSIVTTEELEAVVRAMGDHLRNEAVLSGACFALKNFTYEERNLRNLRQFEKIYSLLEDAAKYSTKAECRADAAEILDRVRSLKEEDESLEQMAYSSLVDMENLKQTPKEKYAALRDVLQDYDWSVKLICHALESFMSLMVDEPDTVDLLYDYPTLRLVMNAMKRQKHNAKVQEMGCKFLKILSEQTAKARSNIVDLDGVNVILTALRKHRGVNLVQAASFGALTALYKEKRCAKEVDRNGGLARIRDMYRERRRGGVAKPKDDRERNERSFSSFDQSLSTIGSHELPAIP